MKRLLRLNGESRAGHECEGVDRVLRLTGQQVTGNVVGSSGEMLSQLNGDGAGGSVSTGGRSGYSSMAPPTVRRCSRKLREGVFSRLAR
jgi:hypothetical protein